MNLLQHLMLASLLLFFNSILSVYTLNFFFFFFFMYVFLMKVEGLMFEGDYFFSNLFYCDKLGYLLIFLTLLVFLCVFLLNYKMKSKLDSFVCVSMVVFLYYCFSVDSYMYMYMYFEAVLVPLVFMILFKGSSPERFIASMYMFIYTFFGSVMLLLMLMILKKSFILMFSLNKYTMFKLSGLEWMMFLMFLVFFVKLPMYMVHMWLPKAHVQAPIEGSMILAGVLLKLGGYGLIRLIEMTSVKKLYNFYWFFMVFSLMGSMYVGMICLSQIDLKKMIAYSSVSHMGMMMSGLFSLSNLGLMGGLVMMLAHGFCSSLMFFMGNMFYERNLTRNLYLFKGMSVVYPVMMVMWLMVIFINMGVPPFMNFMGELMLIFSVMKKSLTIMFILVQLMMVSLWYSLFMFLRFGHGMVWNYNYMNKENFMEMIIVILHFSVLFFYFLKMSFFLL